MADDKMSLLGGRILPPMDRLRDLTPDEIETLRVGLIAALKNLRRTRDKVHSVDVARHDEDSAAL
jgi:hypothetical protein